MVGLGLLGGGLLSAILGALGGAAGNSYLNSNQQNNNQSFGGFNNNAGGGSFSSLPRGGSLGNFSALNQGQQNVQNQLLSLLGSQLGQADNGNDPLAQYSQRQFQNQGLPQLLERFTQHGSTLQGSGARNSIINAQADISSQLGAQRYQTLQNLLGTALNPSTNQVYMPRDGSGIEGLLKGLSGGVGSTLPLFAAKYGIGF
jgi:hypothetical protein